MGTARAGGGIIEDVDGNRFLDFNAGIAVQDAAYLVIVPNVTPDTPALERNPVFFYMSDGFQKPTPFEPTVVVDIESTLDKKVRGLAAHASQMFEWLPWVSGNRTLEGVPSDPAERLTWLRERWTSRTVPADWRAAMAEWYPAAAVERAQYVEHGDPLGHGEVRVAHGGVADLLVGLGEVVFHHLLPFGLALARFLAARSAGVSSHLRTGALRFPEATRLIRAAARSPPGFER